MPSFLAKKEFDTVKTIRKRYSFMGPLVRVIIRDEIAATVLLSEDEFEELVSSMTDPNFQGGPQIHEPYDIYPRPYRNDPLKRAEFERAVIAHGHLPPLRLIPEDSLLRAEWFRRAEIIKKEIAAAQREAEAKNT